MFTYQKPSDVIESMHWELKTLEHTHLFAIYKIKKQQIHKLNADLHTHTREVK